MRVLLFLVIKEFKQIFRDRTMRAMILIAPLIQLLLLPLVADYEIKNINISVTDNDRSAYSREILSHISASPNFSLLDYGTDYREALQMVENDRADLILEIPHGFESNLVRGQKTKLFVAANAINNVKASVGSFYLRTILAEVNQGAALQRRQQLATPSLATIPDIDIVVTNRYNPTLNYRQFMVPGILVVLMTMIGLYVCSMNVVKEKEMGTIEQINVTPIKKHQFVLGKLLPLLITGIVLFSIGLFVIARYVYSIVPSGSLLLLYGHLTLYLAAILGLGLLISTVSQTQQQAMSMAFFFMIIFMMMSGIFTPADSMPSWARLISELLPTTHFVETTRMIILKGSTLDDTLPHLVTLSLFAAGFNALAIFSYRKTQ